MLKQVKEMPTSGQFVAVWTYDSHALSETYKWVDDELWFCSDVESLSQCVSKDETKNHLARWNATFFVEAAE